MSDRFNASIKRGHQTTLSNVMGRLQAGQMFSLTPQEFIDLSDLAGALNYWAAQEPPTAEVQPEILYGDFARRYFVPGHAVYAFPFRVDARARHLYGSVAENPSVGGASALRLGVVSRVAGDLSNAPGNLYGRGKEVAFHITPDVEFPVGELLYFNTMIDEPVAESQTGSGFSIVWQTAP